jgi:DnaJ-class molecular chaperone
MTAEIDLPTAIRRALADRVHPACRVCAGAGVYSVMRGRRPVKVTCAECRGTGEVAAAAGKGTE